ncbi:MAG: hypothetical protein VYA67_16590 [Actinomycetota bacterium]|uniref:Uncharacterized protein n=1 Tax=Mycobacterium lentiflavum TaxID=141349 RepID=A0ABY3USK6_MYCLN|nr:hypothetical protein [Mycobacterium lentiflavum]MEE3065544.1 hypothetical protein [Actinomycetota bacterium]ULP42578.1 hypothetical protein MJO58_00685 [Mycobacterium lentiflavum]
MAEPDYEVAIIGAGPGGIATAKLLRDTAARCTRYQHLRANAEVGQHKWDSAGGRRSRLRDYKFCAQPAAQPQPAPPVEELSA